MHRAAKVAAALAALAATVTGLVYYRERFDIIVKAPVRAYTELADCHTTTVQKGHLVDVPASTRLTVTWTDWSGKSFPCCKSEYGGVTIWLTGDQFEMTRPR